MPLHCVLFFLALFLSPQSYASEDSLDKRVAEINEFGPVLSTWEGMYVIKHLADENIENHVERIHARMTFSDERQKVQVILGFDSEEDMGEIVGLSRMYEDGLGWMVHIERRFGYWIEKYVFTFSRTGRNESMSTLTRTVHNWHIEEGDEVPEFYSMFGEGKLTRSHEGT